MTAVMEGVRILEVAEHTFVPASSALLSDWGAEVIKIEPVDRGDAMRGLASTGTAIVPDDVHVLLEHSNRGKRSLGLDLAAPDGLDVLYRLAATADVFLTNKLAPVRTKLKIDVDDIRAHNPDIIYVRGTGHRERTGEPTVVDVSLLGTGMWAQGQAIGLSVVLGKGWAPPPATAVLRNPLVRNYRTKDGRWLALNCLQAARYWTPLCEAIGRPELATDPRFADHESLADHSGEATEILRAVFADATVDEWRTRLQDFVGQWTVVQDTLEAARDAQSVANGYLQPSVTAGGVPFELVAAPVQFDEQPATPGRAPEFNEHGDVILEELGLDWDAVVDLKMRGVVA